MRDHINEQIKNVGAIACCVLYFVIASYNQVSMDRNEYQYKVAFIVGVFAAIAFLFRLSKWLFEVKMIYWVSNHLAYIGKNSLCIVIWHLLMFRVPILLQIFMMHAGLNVIMAFPVYVASGLWWLVYLVAGIYLSLRWRYGLRHNPLSLVMRRGGCI